MMTLGFSRSFSCSFKFLSFSFADLLRLCASLALRFLPRFHTLFAHTSLSETFVQSFFQVFLLRYLLSSYPWDHCVFPSLVSLRLARRSARVGLTVFRFYHYGSGSSFLYVLEMTPQLLSALDGLGVLPAARLYLSLGTLLKRQLFPWMRVKRK